MIANWLGLASAIIAEVIATSALKASDNFSRFWPSVAVVVGYATAIYLLSSIVQTIPLGITYAIWSGVGIVLITAAGWVFYGQVLDAAALVGLGLIISGVLVIHLLSSAGH